MFTRNLEQWKSTMCIPSLIINATPCHHIFIQHTVNPAGAKRIVPKLEYIGSAVKCSICLFALKPSLSPQSRG